MPTPALLSSRVALAEYERRHHLSAQLTEAVNACYLRQAPFPAAFLAEHFSAKGLGGSVTRVRCRETLDARGVPQVAATVYADGRALGAACPGSALLLPADPAPAQPRCCAATAALRDGAAGGAAAARHAGKGCRAVAAACAAAATKALSGRAATDQLAADEALAAADGTAALSALGANALCAVSVAVACAGATARGSPLWQQLLGARYRESSPPVRLHIPTPIMWLLEPPPGGKLALRAVGLIPTAAPGAAPGFSELYDACCEVYHAVGRKLLAARPDGAAVAPGGAYTYAWDGVDAALDALRDAVDMVRRDGKLGGVEMRAALRCGGSGFAPGGGGYTPQEGAGGQSQAQLAGWYAALADREKEPGRLGVAYLEDTHWWDEPAPPPPEGETPRPAGDAADTFGDGHKLLWAELAARGHAATVLAGGDLYSTNIARLRDGRRRRVTPGAVLSVDEAGTVSRLADAAAEWARPLPPEERPAGEVAAADPNGPGVCTEHPVVVGARPNDAPGSHAADVAVGMQAHFVSLGGLATAESVAHWDRLREIEQELDAAGRLCACPPLRLPPAPPLPAGARDLAADQGARKQSVKGKKK